MRTTTSPRANARGLQFPIVAAVLLAAGCAETTVPGGPKPVATVAVTAADTLMRSFGDTLVLQAVARDEGGNEIAGKTFSWSSAQADVATVTEAGRVIAVGNGLATLTATVDEKSGSKTIRVEQVLDSIALSTRSVNMGSINQTTTLTATALDARDNPIAALSPAWSSSATGIATVNQATGVVRALANGEATVTATIGGMSAPVQISVAQVPAQLAFVAQPITTQKAVSIPAITVAVRDALGTNVAGATTAVSIALGPGLSSGVLSGATQVNAVNGVATFTGLSVDVAATYTLAASATGTSFATSNAFDIMDTPARIDSVKLATTDLKRGTSTSFQIWITNGAGRNLTSTITQGYLVIGGNLHAVGGAQVSCGAAGGVVPHGTCKMDRSLSLNASTPLGPTTARILLIEGQTERGRIEVPVTVVP